MKATRIVPIDFGVDGNAVWANIHGPWIYEPSTQTVTVTPIVFAENGKTLRIYKSVNVVATKESWQEDIQVVEAAFAAHGIQIDNDYVEPLPVDPDPQQETPITEGGEV